MNEEISLDMDSPWPSTEIRRHMLEVLELRKLLRPNETFAKLPALATSYAKGFHSVSNVEVWNAVNHIAWWLDENLGKSKTFETLAYLGPGDLRYSIILLAAIKTGYKVFYPSLRNSKVAFESLFRHLKCKIVITTSPEPAPVSLLGQCDISQKLHVPSLQELFDIQDVTDYPYDKTYEQAKHDPVCVLHTSGSTGIPRPLVYTNEFIASVASNTSLEPPEGFDSPNRLLIKGSSLITLPVFHMAGLAFTLFVPIFNDSVPIYPLPGPPPSLQSLVKAVSNTDVDWVLVPPITLQEMSQDRDSLNTIASKVKYLFYIGGMPPREAGDVVASSLPLHQVFGSSEFGSFPLLYREPLSKSSDWRSVEFHPQIHAELRKRFDDLHELVLVNKPVHGRPQPVFALFPELGEYETGDLFTPHRQSSNLWEHQSRLDDVIVFLTGEKTNPVSFEHIVSGHPEVRDVLVVGEGRFETSLLVELLENKGLTAEEKVEAIERIWSVVQNANDYCPRYAQVSQSKILFTNPGMPMARTGKGTVQRKATIALYKEALDDLYNMKDTGASFTLPENFDITDRNLVSEVIQKLVRRLTGWDQIANEDEFFSLGMDSLIVHRLSRELKQQPEFSSIEPRSIYMNPSIDSLTDVLIGFGSQPVGTAKPPARARAEQMAELLEAHNATLDILCKDTHIRHTRRDYSRLESQVVLLTGSTGNIGSFLLDGLLRDSNVAHIYCLNRSPDSRAVQISRSMERGLPVEFPPARVTFLTGNLATSELGLSIDAMSLIKSTVTQIIHNAWPVDFNRSLISFESSLDGIVNLLLLAAHSNQAVSLVFLSSISAVANYHKIANADPLVPEVVIRDMECPANTGYGESKYLGELVLDHACQKMGLETGIVRIGQIAGSVDTLRGWNRNEWLPSLIISSKHIGALPESLGFGDDQNPAGILGDIDWIPVDRLSSLILEFGSHLARNETRSGPLVYHAVNPATIAWTKLLPKIRASLSDPASGSYNPEGEGIRLLPYSDWLETLRSKSSTEGQESGIGAEMAYKNPGFKLLDFYTDISYQKGMMSRLSTEQTSKISPLIQELEPLRAEWMAGWIQDWLSTKGAN